jgi:hypothetical protein
MCPFWPTYSRPLNGQPEKGEYIGALSEDLKSVSVLHNYSW